MLTVGEAERRLRKLLLMPRLKMELYPLKDAAGHLRFKPLRIRINPYNGCITDTVIHELIHLAYDRRLERWGAFEEPIITEAIEDQLVRYINRSNRRRSWWHRTIQAKLPDPDRAKST